MDTLAPSWENKDPCTTLEKGTMGLEIERKYLVPSSWTPPSEGGVAIRQAYLPEISEGTKEARVRISQHPDGRQEAWLTQKGDGDLVRSEQETPISLAMAEDLMRHALGNVIEKTRHALPLGDGKVLEVDVYAGALAGLVVAEVELPSVDATVQLPDWVGEEITHQSGYKNKSLALHGLPAPSDPPAVRRGGPAPK